MQFAFKLLKAVAFVDCSKIREGYQLVLDFIEEHREVCFFKLVLNLSSIAKVLDIIFFIQIFLERGGL